MTIKELIEGLSTLPGDLKVSLKISNARDSAWTNGIDDLDLEIDRQGGMVRIASWVDEDDPEAFFPGSDL